MVEHEILFVCVRLASNSLSVYRGKTGMADFIVGGAFAGGAFRFWHGPRGFIVGIGLGM